MKRIKNILFFLFRAILLFLVFYLRHFLKVDFIFCKVFISYILLFCLHSYIFVYNGYNCKCPSKIIGNKKWSFSVLAWYRLMTWNYLEYILYQTYLVSLKSVLSSETVRQISSWDFELWREFWVLYCTLSIWAIAKQHKLPLSYLNINAVCRML